MKKHLFSVAVVTLILCLWLCFPALASTNNKTRQDAVNWILDWEGKSEDADGAFGVQCVDLIKLYYKWLGHSLGSIGNAYNLQYTDLPSGWEIYGNNTAPRPGDIFIWNANSYGAYDTGHVGLIYDVDDSYYYFIDFNRSANHDPGKKGSKSKYSFSKIIRPDFSDRPMTRKNVLSGVYIIHSAWNDNYCLDIQNNSKENNANIQLYQRVYGDVQKFRIIKWSDDYYCIQSIYNGLWLDVALPIENRANVKLYENNKADENDWYFEDAGDGYVYIRNRTGYYLDIAKDAVENNANIQIYSQPENNSQRWRLEEVTDYCYPEDGVYTVSTARNNSYRLDIFEDSKENRANIQLYRQLDTPVQLFRFIKKGSYYVIQSVYSGKWLDIHLDENGNVGNNSNVQLWESNTSDEEHWVLENAGNGYVYIRSNNDYYLDIQGDVAKDNANIQVYRFANNDSQRWRLTKYEHSVKYDANNGLNPPSSQVKVYGQTLTLSSAKPTRTGYTFLGWATSASATTAAYQPGGSYTKDEDVTLYAVWKVNAYTVSYNANTTDPVGNMPTNQTKDHGIELALSNDQPTREGYSFICWSTSADAYENNRYSGSVYTGNADLTLYAMWAENGKEMIEGAGKVFLDGNYKINNALNETFSIDIQGTEYPAEDGTNVHLYDTSEDIHDIWTLTYLNNGFYSIKQCGTDMALTVANGSLAYRANIQVNHYTGGKEQQWSIEKTKFGFRLRARHSGFSVDIIGGQNNITNGTNLRQYVGYVAGDYTEGHEGNQSWTFMPFKPAQGLIPDFVLPASLETVEAEAFTGGGFWYVRLPEGMTAIGARAFADCPNLRYIYIPEGCNSIAKDAFSGVNGMTIFGVDGSYAEFFADKYGYVFEPIDVG